MRSALLLMIALSACGDDAAVYSPDAANHAADAAIDAFRQADAQDRGCMGNLPDSRSFTINTGDPIPPELLNELQDMVAGDRRKSRWRSWFPTCWAKFIGTDPTLVPSPVGGPVAPVWHILGNPPTSVATRIPHEEGEIIEAVKLELLGDGVVDWGGTLIFFESENAGAPQHGIADNGAGSSNQTASWVFDTSMNTTLTFTLPATGFLLLGISTGISGAAGVLHVGNVYLKTRR